MKSTPRRIAAMLSTVAMAAGVLVGGGAGVVSAQTPDGTGQQGGMRFARTLSATDVNYGDEMTVTTTLRNPPGGNFVYWMEDAHPSCFKLVDLGSNPDAVTWTVGGVTYTNGSNPSEVTYSGTAVKVDPPLANSWVAPIVMTSRYRVECAASSNLNSGGFSWNGSVNTGSFPSAGPLLKVNRKTTSVTVQQPVGVVAGTPTQLSAVTVNALDGSQVQFVVDGVVVGSGPVSGNLANFTWTPSTAGAVELQARVVETATHASSESAGVTVNVTAAPDVTAPDTPENISITPQPANSGATVTVSGDAEPGSTVSVKVDGLEVCSATAAPEGSVQPPPGVFSCTFTSNENQNGKPVTVTAEDAAGNVSDAAEPGNLAVSASIPPTTVTSTVTSTQVVTTTQAPSTVTETSTVTSQVPTTVVSTVPTTVPTTVTETSEVPTTVVTTVPTTVTETTTVTSEVPTTVTETSEVPTTVVSTVPTTVPTTVVSTVPTTVVTTVPTTVIETTTVTPAPVTTIVTETVEVPTTVINTTTETAAPVTTTVINTTTETAAPVTTTEIVTSTETSTATATVTSTVVSTPTTTVSPGGTGSIGSGSLGSPEDGGVLGSVGAFFGALLGSLGLPVSSVDEAVGSAGGSSEAGGQLGSLGSDGEGDQSPFGSLGSTGQDAEGGSVPLGSLGALPLGSLASASSANAGSMAVGSIGLGALAIGGIIYGVNTGSIPLPQIDLPSLPPELRLLLGLPNEAGKQLAVAPGPLANNGRG